MQCCQLELDDFVEEHVPAKRLEKPKAKRQIAWAPQNRVSFQNGKIQAGETKGRNSWKEISICNIS